MILSVSGEAKTGKTTFAYTAPGKVVGFSFDIGAERALYGVKFEQFEGRSIKIVKWEPPTTKPQQGKPFKDEILTRRIWDDHDITIYELPQPVQINAENLVGVRELWQTFLVLFQTAVLDPAVRTIVLDTASLARRVVADAWLQELQEGESDPNKKRKNLLQIEYGKPNDAIRAVYSLMASSGKNLVVVHHLRDRYVGDKPTGTREVEGIKEADRLWDVGIRTKKGPKGAISLEYTICGYNLSLEKTPVAGDNWNAMVGQISMSLGDRIDFERAD